MDKTEIFTKLIHRIREMNGFAMFIPMNSNAEGIMTARCKRSGEPIDFSIGIRGELDFDGYLYNLAHELAHFYLHYDKGDMIGTHSAEYEEQADRAARMILDVLSQE